ncbi:MAG TPA: hypothetical protein VD905_16735, partial [Flavobacteriales bacterium]|nr:hypothetical protein [Flavobacteriales bacterium]
MKKFLLFSLLLATLFSVNGQNHFIAEPRYKALVQGVPLTAVPSYEANETGESVKRTTCTDKITYLDFYGSPSSYWQVGGASAWWATGTSLNECIQVYPGYTGQVTRVDFLGGKITSNETVTIRLCSINASEVPVSVLATTTATVNSTTGEFGGAFSTPINVTNGFAVSVYLPSSTDSVNVS